MVSGDPAQVDDFYLVYFSHSRLLSLPDHGRSHVGHSSACRHAHAQGMAFSHLLDVRRQLDGNACASLPTGKHCVLHIAIEPEPVVFIPLVDWTPYRLLGYESL